MTAAAAAARNRAQICCDFACTKVLNTCHSWSVVDEIASGVMKEDPFRSFRRLKVESGLVDLNPSTSDNFKQFCRIIF